MVFSLLYLFWFSSSTYCIKWTLVKQKLGCIVVSAYSSRMCMPTFFLCSHNHTFENGNSLSCFFSLLSLSFLNMYFDGIGFYWSVLFNIYGPRAESDDSERVLFKLKFYNVLQVIIFLLYPRCDIYEHYIIFRQHAYRVFYPFANLGYFTCRKDGSIFCI